MSRMMQRPHTDHPRPRSSIAGGLGLLLALLAAALLAGATPAAAAVNCSPSAGWGTNRPDLASQVVALVNQYRASNGLGALSYSPSLTAASTWKSLHMAGYGYFAHSDPAPPVARDAFQRARDCDYRGSTWGENIAWGYPSPQAVVTGWINSPGHRANILNTSFTTTGVGVAASASGTLLWTQNFGNDAGSPAPAPAPPASTPPPPPPAPRPAPVPAPASSAAPSAAPRVPAPPPAPTPAGAPAPLAAASAPPSSTGPGSVTPSLGPGGGNAGGSQPPAGGAAPTASALLTVGAKPALISRTSRNTRLLASVPFVHLASGKPLASAGVRCRAEVDGRRLRVLANVFKASAARCAWRIPRWARGKRLVGVVAVQVGQKAAIRVFRLELR